MDGYSGIYWDNIMFTVSVSQSAFTIVQSMYQLIVHSEEIHFFWCHSEEIHIFVTFSVNSRGLSRDKTGSVHKILYLKNRLFTKCFIPKTDLSQNSSSYKRILHKILPLKNGPFAKFFLLKTDLWLTFLGKSNHLWSKWTIQIIERYVLQ